MRQLLTSGTVARQMGVSRERVNQLERAGHLKAALRDSIGRRLFEKHDVLAFLKRRKKDAVADRSAELVMP